MSRSRPLQLEILEDRNLLSGGGTSPLVGSLVYTGQTVGATQELIEPDGRILVASWTNLVTGVPGMNPTEAILSLTRFNPDGSPDTTFGNGGQETLPDNLFSEEGGVALGPNGQIVVAGASANYQVAVARLNADGSLDTTFAAGGPTPGVALFSVGENGGVYEVAVPAIQADGRIVVGGEGNWLPALTTSMFLARLNTDGTLDQSFDAGGSQPGILPIDPTPFQLYMSAAGGIGQIAVQADDKIVITIRGGYLSSAINIELARFNADGSLDSTFGDGGIATAYSDVAGYPEYMTIQPDGGIIVEGTAGGLSRFNADGSLDTTFGTGGSVAGPTFASGGQALLFEANGFTLQADGSILVFGSVTESGMVTTSMQYTALARYTPDGALDSTFGSGGEVLTDFGSACQPDPVPGFTGEIGSEAVDVGLEPDGTIVVLGADMPYTTQFFYPDVIIAGQNYYRPLAEDFGNKLFLTAYDPSGQDLPFVNLVDSDSATGSGNPPAQPPSGIQPILVSEPPPIVVQPILLPILSQPIVVPPAPVNPNPTTPPSLSPVSQPVAATSVSLPSSPVRAPSSPAVGANNPSTPVKTSAPSSSASDLAIVLGDPAPTLVFPATTEETPPVVGASVPVIATQSVPAPVTTLTSLSLVGGGGEVAPPSDPTGAPSVSGIASAGATARADEEAPNARDTLFISQDW
jgi:uncharacterized delta-60 repeat protein